MSGKGQVLARGRTAEVRAWDAGQVVKVYFPQFRREDAEYEAQIAGIVQAAGVACPRFYGLIDVEGRPALVYEQVLGSTLGELVMKSPWRLPALARRMALLHYSLHQPLVQASLPLQREKYQRRIDDSALLPAAQKARLLGSLATLPLERRLCHGDFHPGNILCAAGGDLAIDWMDVSLGHPMADVARSSILLRGLAATAPNLFLRWAANWFHQVYLAAYFQCGGDPLLYRAFLPIVAAARLAEGIAELQAWLLEQAAA